jgi:Fe-Mn family superoxide dismutase
MELHHSKHHQTYVNSYNDATEKMAAAEAKDDTAAKIALQPLINFHGGGHINHSLFWENLAPKNSGGGEPPSGALAKAIEQSYGGLDGLKTKFNAALAGIQGSGWAWLVQDTQTGSISIKTYAVSISIQKRLRLINRPSHGGYEGNCNFRAQALTDVIPLEPRSRRWTVQAPSRH